VNVLVCDEQPLVRSGLCRIFENEADISVVAEAANGADAIELLGGLRPDVILTDMYLSDIDGVELARAAARTSRPARSQVIFLAQALDRESVLSGLRVGGRAFLLKSDASYDIVAAVRSVAAGHTVFSAVVSELFFPDMLRFSVSCEVIRPAGLSRLTGRETDVLSLLAEGMNNNEIAETLALSPATVKSHVSRLLAKLDLRDRAQAIVAAYRSGLTWADWKDTAHDTRTTRPRPTRRH
jgi:DNA-binding NarL/FixJ family response regulator